jgi:prepilin-type N-terminal cleavage/methylation domain-containing protein
MAAAACASAQAAAPAVLSAMNKRSTTPRARLRRAAPDSRSGYTLIELIVVILIIGIMAGIASPVYYQHIENMRAQEGIEALNDLRAAQARYLQKYGAYCLGAAGFSCPGFDVTPTALTYFNNPGVLTPTAGAGAPSWQLTLTRNPATASTWFGPYTIKLDVEPSAGTFTCTTAGPVNCQSFMPAQQ